jgi:hypothetical protein
MKLAFDKISFPFCLKNFNPCNASSGSVYISACVQPRISPCAALSPVRTPNPYPSFSSTRTLRQPGYRGSRPRSTSGLLSVEPLSTRMTSTSPWRVSSLHRSNSKGRLAASL